MAARRLLDSALDKVDACCRRCAAAWHAHDSRAWSAIATAKRTHARLIRVPLLQVVARGRVWSYMLCIVSAFLELPCAVHRGVRSAYMRGTGMVLVVGGQVGCCACLRRRPATMATWP